MTQDIKVAEMLLNGWHIDARRDVLLHGKAYPIVILSRNDRTRYINSHGGESGNAVELAKQFHEYSLNLKKTDPDIEHGGEFPIDDSSTKWELRSMTNPQYYFKSTNQKEYGIFANNSIWERGYDLETGTEKVKGLNETVLRHKKEKQNE